MGIIGRFRYQVSRFLIHSGIIMMPECSYKTLLILRLWELRKDVEDALEKSKVENEMPKL